MHETKEDVKQGVLCEFYEIFQNMFFIEQTPGFRFSKEIYSFFWRTFGRKYEKRLVRVLPDFVLKISEKEC